MLRVVTITVPAERTEALLSEVQALEGLIGVRLQRGGSVHPSGDVVTVEVANEGLSPLMRVLARPGVFQSFTTTEPASVVATEEGKEAISREPSETTWEEMETVIGKESNMTVNALALMAVSGVLAAVGLGTNALHYVIAAMLIAPGFEPITRVSLGIAAGGPGWRRGVRYTLTGYLALVLGAAAAALVLLSFGLAPGESRSSYLPAGVLFDYWTKVSPPSLFVSAVASIAGGILIATGRSVLTAGVMVALALVPSAAIVGIGLAGGDWRLSGDSALRWLIEVLIVGVFALLVFGWKRMRVHKRRTLL